MKKNLFCLSAIAIALGSAAPAWAQSIEGAVQIGVGTQFLSYTSEKVTTPTGNPNIERVDRTKTTRWGLSNAGGFQLEGGYGLTDSLILGGLLSLGGTSATITDGNDTVDTSTLNVFLAPKIDYLFLPGSVFRPALGAAAGLVVQITSFDNNDDLSLAGLGILARAGGKWFITPGFSLDPNLFFGWNTLSGSRSFVGNTSIDASASSVSVGLSLGVSGWIK